MPNYSCLMSPRQERLYTCMRDTMLKKCTRSTVCWSTLKAARCSCSRHLVWSRAHCLRKARCRGEVRDNRIGRYRRVGSVSNAGRFHQRLLTFYQKYNTEKVGDVTHVLVKYKDKETKLFDDLKLRTRSWRLRRRRPCATREKEEEEKD